MLVMIDNYDSFTYNLVQYLRQLGQEVMVFHHDQVDLARIAHYNPSHIVISPGPKAPQDAGISMAVIEQFFTKIPILGICLGHQCIGQVFGAKIIQAPEIMHGKTSIIKHNYQRLFKGIPNNFLAARYHSLVVEVNSLPQDFAIDAWADTTIMAISHKTHPLFGLQFHPEAILSEYGFELLSNFLRYT